MSGPPVTESEPERLPALEKAILDIKAAFGQYSDDEIRTLLKECNMDPEQTTQKLQFYETFQVVKRKERKEKKVVSFNGRRGLRDGRYSDYDGEWQKSHGRQENQNGPRFRNEKNGSRDGQARQENRSQNHSENNGSREGLARQEKRAPRAKGVQKDLKKESKEAAPPAVASTVDESTPPKNPSSAKSNLEKNRPGKLNNVSSGSKPGPGPTPASTPTKPTPAVPRQQQQPPKKSSLGNSSDVGPLSSPSPSDPVVEPTPRNHGAIQRETRNQKLNVSFSGKQQAVVFPNRELPPEAFNCDISFGTLDTVLGKSNNTEAAPKNDSQSPIDEPQPESTPPPGSDHMFNQPKQEVLPPVGRSQQETQQVENASSLQTSNLTPPMVPSSAATYPFVQSPYSSMFPYYSTMYMPPVPRNVHPAAVMGHSEYTNQPPTGAGAIYPPYMQQNMRPNRDENKEENVFYNLVQGQTMAAYPPPAAAQGGHVFPSVYQQSPNMSSAPLSQQQVGGETVPLGSYPRSQLQYGGQYWNPNREN